MATQQDAEEGYRLLRESDFNLGFDELNEELVRQGFAPVSARMWAHYRKLRRYGYDSYLPINQLDVKTLQDPVWNKATQGGRILVPKDLAIELRLLVDGNVRHLSGRSVEIGEGEIVAVVSGTEAIELLDNLGKTPPIAEVVFEGTGEIAFGQVLRVNIDVARQTVRVRLSLNRPLDPRPLLDAGAAEFTTLTIRIGDVDELVLSELAQLAFWLYQALESTRRILLDVVEGEPAAELLSPPSVRSVSYNTPLVVVISVATAVAVGFTKLVERWVRIRSEWLEGNIKIQTERKLRWENDQTEARKELRGPEAVSLLSPPTPALPPVGDTETAATTLTVSMTVSTEIAEKQLLPSIFALVEAADGVVEIAAEPPLPDWGD
jgi:hypothetical protein